MRLILLGVACVAVLFHPALASSVTIHVPGDYDTVCEATAVAEYGDTVLVGPGIHEYHRPECAAIPDGVTVTSEAGPIETTLYAWQWGPGGGTALIRFDSEVSAMTGLSGFTILCADLAHVSVPAAIYCPGGSPRIMGNVIRPSPSYPDALSDAVGVLCVSGASPEISRNTFVGFEDDLYFTQGTVVECFAARPTVSHNIMAHADRGIVCIGGASPTVTCNDLWDIENPYSQCEPGTGDFYEDPLFCDPDSHDYTIHCESPAAHGYGCGHVGALPVGCGPTSSESESWGAIKGLFR